ncbi:JAB domain-containing protein [Longirhabdus pacifica]|uniref:JAB domain-containing protein n=1 Tax=Longirhabdus pacifica TaxID=2305227 RepID=UPI0010087E3B|nr:DNA repair protein RadC [Longirhabdus pacifica]
MNSIEIIKIKQEKVGDLEAQAISSTDDAIDILDRYIGEEDREHFVVLCLNIKHKITAIHTVSIGQLNATIIHPREVFKPAILHNSAVIIVGHNHPSGDPRPSDEDIEITKRLENAGEILGIRLLDHIIVGNNSISLREKGYLN